MYFLKANGRIGNIFHTECLFIFITPAISLQGMYGRSVTFVTHNLSDKRYHTAIASDVCRVILWTLQNPLAAWHGRRPRCKISTVRVVHEQIKMHDENVTRFKSHEDNI